MLNLGRSSPRLGKTWLALSVAAFTGFAWYMALWAGLRDAAASVRSFPPEAGPGDVVINEIAWMGTTADYADEWIELHNTTATSVTLTGWRLAAGDGSPDIPLDGAIPAGGYFLLERTDDATVGDIPADQIYTGALENDPAAETLSLYDGTNALIDTANSDGGSWPAGDNATKRTMERIDPGGDGGDDNWATNDGLTRNGHDAAGNPINGTPKTRNSASATPPQPAADLSVIKSGPVSVAPGDRLTYTLRLSNTGSFTATAVRLTDSLPPGVSFLLQDSDFPFQSNGGLLAWTVGDVAPGAPRLCITVTGQVTVASSDILRNVITATTRTTDTALQDNYAAWETQVDVPSGAVRVLVSAVLYDGYQLDDRDEAVQLTNVGDSPADLAGWRVCDAPADGTCVTIVSGTLDPGATTWLAYWASAFYTSSGFYPAYAVKRVPIGTSALSGSWPQLANAGEAVVLQDAAGVVIDTLVYAGGDPRTWGWSGPAVYPWSNGGLFGTEGQILYRKLDEATGLPIPDTNTAADWAQDPADPAGGRRVRYPGWDLEAFYRPLTTTTPARLTLAVAPDCAADLALNAIASAEERIELAVYSLRHPAIVQALAGKASAGVTVTVLLEGDPAGMSKIDARWYQEMWACQTLHATGHGNCWFMINAAEARIFDRYRYMHAKYLLVDRRQVLISTQNLTPDGMPDDDRSNGTCGSRGVVMLIDAPAVVARVGEVFDRDLDAAHHADLLPWMPGSSTYGPPPPDFTPVLSVADCITYPAVFSQPLALEDTFDFELFTAPEAALRASDALLGLLGRAGTGDAVYVEALDERAAWGPGEDPEIDPSVRMAAYIGAARRGARVRILLNGGRFDAEYVDLEANAAAVAYANTVARQERLDLRAALGDPTHFGIHNKMILVWLVGEGGIVHLGSLNGTETASKANRELAVQVHSDALYTYLKQVFDWDWYISRPVYLPCLMRGWRAPDPPVGYPVISEVLYDPSGAEEGGEWVELYNPTGTTVDLSSWHLGDVGPGGEFGSGLYRFPGGTNLPSGAVLLVARQAADAVGFLPDFEFLVDPLRDDPAVPNMLPAGGWEGFGFALGNAGDEVLLLDPAAIPVDVLVYGAGSYPGVVPHPGVSIPGHSLERRPAIYDTDDCSHDFFDRYPPDPGGVGSHSFRASGGLRRWPRSAHS